MDFDKRIKEKPLTCFEAEEAKKYIGKECYMSRNSGAFSDLDFALNEMKNLKKCVLTEVSNIGNNIFHSGIECYTFCLPSEWVELVEDYKPSGTDTKYDELLKRIENIEKTLRNLSNRFESTERKASTLASLFDGNPYSNCSAEAIKMMLRY